MVSIQARLSLFDKHCAMRGIIFGIFSCLATVCSAQYFQFSQYNFTPQRVNPATVAGSDYASLSFNYRNQATDGGFHLNSNMVNLSYPLLNKTGGRWSGIGLSLMDDRAGQSGIFNTQEIALSYAVNVNLAKFQSLSLGVKALYQNRKMDLNGLYTGSQYIPDRGFDESISSGENLGMVRNDIMTFSAGLHWQQTDKKGNSIAYWDISFFDFNRPEDAFLEVTDKLNSTLVGALGFRIYHEGNMSIYPEFLYTRSGSNNVLNAGAIIRCDLKSDPGQLTTHVDLITKYVFGRSGILGFQFHRENFSAGFSYDFPVLSRNVANTGAFEIALAFRKLITRSKKNKETVDKEGKPVAGQTAKTQPGKKLGATVGVKKPNPVRPAADSSKVKSPAKIDLSARLKQKQDSVITQANAGHVSHEPLVLEKATLHFNFEFNSTTLDENATEYLDGLAKALIDNPELKIKLTGHTDNVGSDKFNLKLSIYRAQTLKQYLVEKGVEAGRIDANGKGMMEPLNKNETEEERAKNRRVELTILYR
jgi:type IX secretion system PorP/SprF family membrane protein